MRVLIARGFIWIGMSILPADVRKMMRDIMLFHVPGALTDQERHEVARAKSGWEAKMAEKIATRSRQQ